MKQLVRYCFFSAIVILAAASCKSPVPEQTKYIPKDASFVLDFNSKSLSEKCASGNINFDSLIHEVTELDKNVGLQSAKEWTDFKNSGVDLDNHIFMFVETGGSIMSGQSTTVALVGLMKDKQKFETYIKNHPEFGEQQNESGYSYVSSENSVAIGWNNNVAIAAFVEKGNTEGDKSKIPGATQTLTRLFAQKETEAVTSIPEFRELMGQTADILTWNNSSNIFNSIPLLSFSKLADLFKDSYSSGYWNFENGKITGNYTSYSGKDLADIMKKNAGPVADMALVNQYPYPAQGFAVFSFKPQIILDIIKYSNLESTVAQALNETGFTADDVIKVFKGDFAVVFSGIGMQQQSYEINGQKINMTAPSAKIVINAAIGDKAAYDKIVKSLAEKGLMIEQNGQYVPATLGGFTWNMDGKNLVITNDNELAQQYLAAKGNASLPADVADKIKGKAVGFYVNIGSILQGFPADSASLMKTTLEHAKNTFKDAVATSENFDGKSVKGSFEVRFVNEKENSLVSLINFISSAAKDVKQEMDERKNRGMTDMASMVEPPAEQVPPPPTK